MPRPHAYARFLAPLASIVSVVSLGSLAVVASLAGPGCRQKSAATPSSPPASPAPAGFSLEYEKYSLENGLTVILHRDPSDPIVAISTVVHVGSAREKPGRTGFAHFFEHMSFNNSENVPMGANRKYIPELGGTRNGGTWDDGTIYYEVVPKDAFAKLMWIDSDRFGYMINTVKEATLEREKQVVKNEKRQRVDNRPYGHTDHVIRKALYPADHPYNWTVIGDLDDLQAATLADVREFYDQYYVPANATLVIAGDIDIDETKKMVSYWFGEIGKGEAPADLAPMPVRLAKGKRLYHLDNFAEVAELRMTFPTVEQTHADRWALDALGAILASGKKAPIYTTVVESAKQSSDVAAYNDSSELAGTFTIAVRANPGVDLDAVLASVEASFARFEADGVRQIDLDRYKAKSETRFYRGIASVLDRAQELGQYEEYFGDANFIFEAPKRTAALTTEDIRRVYAAYIKDKPAIVTSFVPKSSPALIVDGSIEAAVEIEKIEFGAEKEFDESDADDFVRTKTKNARDEPPLGPTPEARIPAPWHEKGAFAIVGIEHHELPMVAFNLRVDGGQWRDPSGKEGLASLFAELLNEGTAKRTPAELEDAIELLGARLAVSASRTSIDFSGEVLAKNFTPLMALLAEMILEPRYDAAELERLRIARLADIRQSDGNPPAIASRVFSRVVFGDDHPAAVPFGGTRESVAIVTLDDIKGATLDLLDPARATLHVAGAIKPAEVKAAVARLERDWRSEPRPTSAYGDGRALPLEGRPYFVDVPGSKQSVIMVGGRGLAGDEPDYYPLTVALNRLGGGSSARLTQTLRIEKGYSYGAWAGIGRSTYPSPFLATSQVRANVTLESLVIFRDLISSYSKTFTDADLATTKNLVSKANTRRFETLGQLVEVLETMTRFDLPDDYIARESRELASLDLASARRLIDAHLSEKSMVYVIVGDASTQLEKVGELGRGAPIRLDRQGAPIEKR